MILEEQESGSGVINTTPTDFTSISSKAIMPRICKKESMSLEGAQKSEGKLGEELLWSKGTQWPFPF